MEHEASQLIARADADARRAQIARRVRCLRAILRNEVKRTPSSRFQIDLSRDWTAKLRAHMIHETRRENVVDCRETRHPKKDDRRLLKFAREVSPGSFVREDSCGSIARVSRAEVPCGRLARNHPRARSARSAREARASGLFARERSARRGDPLQTLDQTLAGDAEDAGGARPISFGVLEHAEDVLLLHLGEGRRPFLALASG